MRKLHPATIVVALLPRLKEAVQTAVPLLIGSFAAGHSGNQEWVAITIGSLTGIFAIGTYWTTRFDIEPEHVVHTSGWIFRKDRRIPLAQIQNVNLRQNLLERIFRVATVDVETAMGRGRDLKLSVLGISDAERFREELLGAAHLDLTGSPKQQEPVVSLNRHDLLLGALTENHLGQMIVGLTTVGWWAVGLIVKFAAKLPPAAATAATVGGITILVIGSWLWGALSYYLKYGDFQVRRSANVFRITFGLLNKVQMAIRPGRIEYVHLTTSLPQRLMGRASLQVGTASSFGEAGVLAPVALFVERYRAYAGVEDVIPGLEIRDLEWRPFHPYFYRAAIVRALTGVLVLLALAVALGTILSGPALIGARMVFGLLALLSMLRPASLFLARGENGFAVTEDALAVRIGYFHQSISAMPIERMENIAVNQPMWWRKGRAARVTVQAMKHRIHAGAMPESDIEELLTRWREKIDTRETRRLYAALAEESTALESDLLPASLAEAAEITLNSPPNS